MDPNTSTGTQQPEKNNTMMFVIGIVVLLLIGVGIVFAMNRSTQPPASVQSTTQPTTASKNPASSDTATPSDAEMEMSGEMVEFGVNGKNFSFSPSTIRVKKGDMVTINFKNTGGFHDFTIDEFDVKTAQIQDGQSETVTFTADKSGTFNFYCSVGQHRANGMEGQLIVE